MALGLGNNLIKGGGSGNADRLSLDLQFAADKTLTARKGPTPVFTRSSTATFVGSDGLIQSAAVNAPRFDHDPLTLACKGLLIEEARTNLLLQSENFGSWQAIGLNTTGTPPYLNVVTAPDGSTSAEKLIATTASSTHQFRRDVTLASGTTYAISVYYKASESNFASIAVYGTANGNNDWVSFFNLSAGSAGTFNGFTSTSITDVGNGWFRCTAIFTATASGTLSVRLGGASGTSFNNQLYAGDGTSGIFLWGAQLEAGAFPTSYIPTTTAALARSADVCSITGSDFSGFYNQSEGSTIVQAAHPVPSAASAMVAYDNDLNGPTARNYLRVGPIARTLQYIISNTTANIISDNVKDTLQHKHSGAYKLDDIVAVFDGAVIGEDSSCVPTVVEKLTIGNQGAGDAALNGHIAAIRYFRKRLSNEKLQTLTRLVPDSDANDYIVSLLATGSTVTPTQQSAINTFVETGKADGWYSSLKRIYLPIWGSAAANAIDLVSRTSGTFVGTVTHGAGYVQGDGSTGYFSTLAPSNTLIATESGFIGTLNKTGFQAPNIVGAASGASTVGTSARSGSGSSGTVPVATWLGANMIRGGIGTEGIITATRHGGSTVSSKRSASGFTEESNTAATTATMGSNNFIFLSSNGFGAFASNEVGAFFLSDGLNATDREGFTLGLKTLWETATGLTLP